MIEWTPEIEQFLADHLQDDTAKLLFSAHRYPSLDMPFIADQIEARRRLRNKLPEWYGNKGLIMGGRVPAEQCSSEQTARYKQSLLEGCHSLCDMTGGMGVDFWYMSRGMDCAVYTECQPSLCEAARHNFEVLSRSEHSRTRIEVREGLSTELPIPEVDVIYLDPARRSDAGSRIYEIEDCVPNVIAWQDELLHHCKRLITKVSPMADLSRTLHRLKGVTDLHIVSVRNECKELLIVQNNPDEKEIFGQDIKIHCVDFLPNRIIRFDFDWNECRELQSLSLVQDLTAVSCLYEPDVSVMKAQAFASVAKRFPVKKLDANTHLFVSDQEIGDFPGRGFVIDKIMPFSSRQLKQYRQEFPQANMSVRNFPLTVEELRKRTGIRDGGSVYLFGCQVNQVGPVLFVCHKFT